MQICHWIFLGHLFFPNFAKDSWEAFTIYILIFTQYAKSEYISVSPFDISNTCGCYSRLFISGAQDDGWYKDQEYIVLISSSTFREKWAYDLLETVEKAFNEENSVKVYSETLTTWHFNNQQEIDQKVDYLKDKYSVPPQAVIFVGDPGWYVCKPLFDTIWRGVPTIICHSMPHTPADINKYYDGEYIPDDKGVALEHFLENAVYYDVPPSFIQKNIIYVVIVLGTAIVLLLFYFMHKRIKKVRETEWQEHLHLLENILDNLPIAAKVKDVDNDMRYTFIK